MKAHQLLLETSTNFGLVALAQNNQVLEEFQSVDPRSHTEITHQYVQKALVQQKMDLNQIDFFTCGIGPGSFTGMRVAINTVKTWNYLLSKPIVEINTLELLAMSYFMNFDSEFVFVANNAFKNMVYNCLYRRGPGNRPEKMTDEKATFVKDIRLEYKNCGLIGDGFTVYEKHIPEAVIYSGNRPVTNSTEKKFSQFDFPNAAAAVQLSWMMFQNGETKDWKSIKPLYIRASEAEENYKGMKYIPL
ncbi:MAG: tRNA (adenosine(37)-N6)-threonylcarbamoyltransferase complex dimerization subunit type 1 TsaB [Pseudobdellovibrionaceae bacterium]